MPHKTVVVVAILMNVDPLLIILIKSLDIRKRHLTWHQADHAKDNLNFIGLVASTVVKPETKCILTLRFLFVSWYPTPCRS